MPLQLGGLETTRPQVVTWDPEVNDQVTEARQRVASLIAQGYQKRKDEDGEVVLDPPPKGDNINVFRVLSQNGDDRIVWDRTDPLQVKEAFRKFKELLKKGYTAFTVLANGKRGHKITEFDPGLMEILMAKGTEVLMVPKTVPG